MDKMKQEVKGKLLYWRRMSAICVILLVADVWNFFRPAQGGESFQYFFKGFQVGLVCALVIFCIHSVMKYRKILNDEELIRAFYIKEHDEREAVIREKTGGTVLYTCGILIILAGVIAGYYNPVVFGSLVSSGVFLLLVRKVLRIYYSKMM